MHCRWVVAVCIWMFEDVKSLGNVCSVIQQMIRCKHFANTQCCCICFTAQAFFWVHNVDNHCRTQGMQGDPFGLLLSQRIIFMGGEVGLPCICASHTSDWWGADGLNTACLAAHLLAQCCKTAFIYSLHCIYSGILWPGRALVQYLHLY